MRCCVRLSRRRSMHRFVSSLLLFENLCLFLVLQSATKASAFVGILAATAGAFAHVVARAESRRSCNIVSLFVFLGVFVFAHTNRIALTNVSVCFVQQFAAVRYERAQF